MERGLQKANQHSRLVEWGRRVEACRNSGQRVNEWCEEHGIPVSTYYSWQRKVFKAVSAEDEVCFAEVPVRPVNTGIREFVEKIVVHAPDKSGGHRVQRIDVHYNFIGEIDFSPEFSRYSKKTTA